MKTIRTIACALILLAQVPLLAQVVQPAGSKADDAGPPGSNNLGTLPCVATAANPSSTEGNQVACSQDLLGRTRVMIPKTTGTCNLVMTSTSNTCEIDVGDGVQGLSFSVADSGSAWTGTIQFQTQAPATGVWFFLAGFNISNGDGTNFTNDFDTCTTSLGASAPGCNQNKNGTWLATGIGGIQRIRLKVQTAGTNTAQVNWVTTGVSDYVYTQSFGDLQQNDPAQVNGSVDGAFTGYAVWPLMMGGHGFSPAGFPQPAIATLPAPTTANNRRATLAMTPYGEAMVQQVDHHLTCNIDTTDEVCVLPTMGAHSVTFSIRGTYNPGAGNFLEWGMSWDGTTFHAAVAYPVDASIVSGVGQGFTGAFEFNTGAGSSNIAGTWVTVLTNGAAYFRIRHTDATPPASNAWASGTAVVTIRGVNAPPIQANFTFGDKAHGSPDLSTSPLKIGARAVSFNSTPTAVSADSRTNLYSTRAGSQFVQPGTPNTFSRTCHVADADNAQTGTACVTVSAGTIVVVTGVGVACSAANTVNVGVRVVFDTDTTFPAASTTGVDGELLRHPGVPPGGGVERGFAGAVLDAGASDEDVRYTMDDPVSGSCSLTVNGYTIAG